MVNYVFDYCFSWFRSLLLFSIVLFLSWNGFSQGKSTGSELEFYGATLIVRDIKASAVWYRKYLKFKVKEYKQGKHVKMQMDSFKLVLKQGKNTLLFSQIRLPKGKKYVHGFNKIGFKTNKIDSVYEYYERYELNLHDGIVYEPNLKKKYFIVSDTDGNMIQVFDEKNDNEAVEFKPYFFSIISSDYSQTIKWYKDRFQFKNIKIMDDTNVDFQNLLLKDSIVLEVLHMPFESLEITEFMSVDRDLAGFELLKFRLPEGKKSSFQMDNSGNKILLLK